MAQAARNLVMGLEGAGCRVRYLIRDRDGKYPAMFDAVLADAAISVVLSGIRMPPTRYMLCASTNATTTGIGLIGASRTPDRCVRCPNRSPIPPR